MANRKIYQYPSQKLRGKSEPITAFNDDFKSLVQDLYDTNNVHQGVGIAAPQIGYSQRVVIIDCTKLGASVEYENPEPVEELGDPQQMVIVNPTLTLSGPKHQWKEACLSIPGVSGMVERSQFVELKFQNYYGEHRTLSLDWPLSGVVQHECDHLDGLLYVNRMRGLSRSMLLKKFQKKQKKLKALVNSMKLPSLEDDLEGAPSRKKSSYTKKSKKRRKRAPKKNHLKKKKR